MHERLVVRQVPDGATFYFPTWQSGDTVVSGMVLASGHYSTLRASHLVIAPDDGFGTMFVVSL